MEKENVVKYIIFSIYSKDGNAVLPLVLAQNKKKKTKIFVDETEFSLSLQYAMKDSPKLMQQSLIQTRLVYPQVKQCMLMWTMKT